MPRITSNIVRFCHNNNNNWKTKVLFWLKTLCQSSRESEKRKDNQEEIEEVLCKAIAIDVCIKEWNQSIICYSLPKLSKLLKLLQIGGATYTNSKIR